MADTDEKRESKDSDEAILKEARERFALAVEESANERARMKEELRFSAGQQWPDQIRNARENDPNGARPCLTMDKIGQYRRQVVNDARQNKPAIKVRPVDSGADVEVADILQGLCRHIEDVSCADLAYDNALDSATGPGLGWFRIRTQLVNEARNEQDVLIDPIENIFSVYADPCWRKPDGSDMEWCFVTEEIPRKRFEKDNPKAEVKDWDQADSDSHWVSQEMVRVAEYYRINKTTTNCLYLDNGEEIEEAKYWELYSADAERPQIVGNYDKETREVEWFKLTFGEVIERTTIPSDYIPVIPVVGNVHWVDGKRQLTGMTFWAMDAQRAYNYARSAFVEQIALAPKAPYVAAAGQIEAYEDEWRNANTSNSPVLRYDTVDINGTPVPAPQRQPSPQPSSGWFQEMEVSGRDMQAALGMYAASVGNEGQEKSGRAILARQKEGDTSTFHYIDNLSRSIRHAGRIIVGMVPKIMDTRRMVRIIGEDGESSQATLDPTMAKPFAKIKQQDGKFKRLFNPTIGKYDVTVTVGPSYNTKRMEAAESMTAMTQGNPALFPIIGDLMIKAMDWPMADEIAKRLKAMLPPEIKQLDQAEEGGESPEVLMVKQMTEQALMQKDQELQMAMQQMQQMAQELQQMQADHEAKAAELMVKSRELAIKEEETRIKAADVGVKEYQAETQRLEVLTAQAQPQQESAEPMEHQPMAPQMDMAAMMQAMAAMQQPINITVPVTVEGKPASIKTGRAIRQPDGSYTMESVETPVDGGMA